MYAPWSDDKSHKMVGYFLSKKKKKKKKKKDLHEIRDGVQEHIRPQKFQITFAYASGQFEQDLCNNNNNNNNKTHKAILSSTRPACEVFHFFLSTCTRYARTMAWANKEIKK